MTLGEMGQEYLLLSQRLMHRVRELRKMRDCIPAEEREQLDTRISLLYKEALETRRTGRWLMGYYEKGACDATQTLHA